MEEKKRATEETLAALGEFDFELWTDASVKDKIGAGAGIIFPKVKKKCGVRKDRFKVVAAAGHLCSSFRGEGVAIRAALTRLQELHSETGYSIRDSSILIASDSQSVLSSLAKGPLSQTSEVEADIWRQLLQLVDVFSCKIVFQFVFSHCGVERNEMADRAADAALGNLPKAKQRKASVHLSAIKAVMKSGLKENWKRSLCQETTRCTLGGGSKFSDLKASSALSRRDEVVLAQLRTGQCRLLGEFRKVLLKDSWDGRCRWCRSAEESVDHVFNKCSNLAALRYEEGVTSGEALFTHPKESAAFVNKAMIMVRGEGNLGYL